MRIFSSVIIILLSLCFIQSSHAAVSFTASKTGGATAVTMNDPAGTSVTYTITNAATSEPIVKLAFQLPNTNISTGSFTWIGASSLPAGWTVTRGAGTREITVQGPAINPGSSASFTLTLGTIPNWTRDVTDLLSRIRATSADGTKKDLKNITLFRRHALRIISMVANPATVAPGSGFTLTITVRNESSATLNSIQANPNPPTMTVLSGTITNPTRNQTPAPNPNPLSLTAGATGTIIYNYTTSGSDNGSISFTASLRHPSTGGITASSVSATSNIVVIGGFVGIINVTPACVYDGNTITVTMTLYNFTTTNITNVIRAITPGGTATTTLLTGQNPAPSVTVPASSSVSYTWTYRINGTTGDTYSFTGTAVDSSTATVTGWTGGIVGGYTVSLLPASVNASSINAVLSWSFINTGCAATNSFSIAIPGGWSWNGDGYSLINQGASPPTESWNMAGSNPVVFTAPSAAEQQPLNDYGEYTLTFGTPSTTGSYTFAVTITDTNGQSVTINKSILVNPFGSGVPNPNKANTNIWREEFR